MTEIDWNTELRKIEREFNGLPPELSPAQVRAQRAAEQRAQQRKTDRANAIGVFARLSLVGLLGAAINFWPYPRDCGNGLFAYLAAEGLVVTGGIWVAICTWRFPMPRMHLVASLVIQAGLGLLEIEVLPRLGYTRATGVWWCGDTLPAGAGITK